MKRFNLLFIAIALFFLMVALQFAQTAWDEQGKFNTSSNRNKLIFSCNGEINSTDTLYSNSFNMFGYNDELVTYKRMASESDSAKISAVLQYSNMQDAGSDLWTDLFTIVTNDSTETQNYIADTLSIRPDKLRLMIYGGAANAKATDTNFYFKLEAKKE